MSYIQWQIIYYETVQGNSPIYDFIEGLAPRVQAKIANTFSLLESYGTAVGSPHAKKLVGTPLWELRFLVKIILEFFMLLTYIELLYCYMDF